MSFFGEAAREGCVDVRREEEVKKEEEDQDTHRWQFALQQRQRTGSRTAAAVVAAAGSSSRSSSNSSRGAKMPEWVKSHRSYLHQPHKHINIFSWNPPFGRQPHLSPLPIKPSLTPAIPSLPGQVALGHFKPAAVGQGDSHSAAFVCCGCVSLAGGGNEPHGLTPMNTMVEGSVHVLLLLLLLLLSLLLRRQGEAEGRGEGGGEGDLGDAGGGVLDVEGQLL